jgi:hypothetical protein
MLQINPANWGTAESSYVYLFEYWPGVSEKKCTILASFQVNNFGHAGRLGAHGHATGL